MSQGIEHHMAGRFVEAAARYTQVVDKSPGHGEAWRLLGVVALQRGDPAARKLLERAIRIDPADALAHSALGAVNESEGNLELAHASYVAARAIAPADRAASVGLTRVALRLGRAAEAIAVGEATVASGAVDPGLLRALGGARLLLREYRSAADALEASLRIAPHADTYAYLAGAYVHLNRAEAAIVAAESLLASDPHMLWRHSTSPLLF
jgi:tetratricopeptide (TPR) repeat protein